MPTAYTSFVADNENFTFPEFAMLCARDFGALISMRDEPLDAPVPERFEPDDFYRKEYEAAKAAYDTFIANPPTEEELSRSYDEYVASEKERHVNMIAAKRLIRGRYERMLTKALKWEPPTPDHQALRRFMIQQLQESIEFDCTEYDLATPDKEGYIFFHKDGASLKSEVERKARRWREELERTRKRNQWLKDLRDSLKINFKHQQT